MRHLPTVHVLSICYYYDRSHLAQITITPLRDTLLKKMQLNSAGSHRADEGCFEDDWLPIGGGRRHPLCYPDRREYVVTFEEPHDSWSPQNWTTWKKYTRLHERGTQWADTCLKVLHIHRGVFRNLCGIV